MNNNPQDTHQYPHDNIKGGWDTRAEEYKDLGLSIGLPPNIILKRPDLYDYSTLLMESLYNDELEGFNSLIAPALRYQFGNSLMIHYSEAIRNITAYLNSTLNVFFQTNDISYVISNQPVEPNIDIITFLNEFLAQYVISHIDIFSDIISIRMLPINFQTVDLSLKTPSRAFSTNVVAISLTDYHIDKIIEKHRTHITSFSKGTSGVVFNVDSPAYTQILINDLQDHQATKLLFPGPTSCQNPMYLAANQITYLNYNPTLPQALAPNGLAPSLSCVIDRDALPLYQHNNLYIYNAIDFKSLSDLQLKENIHRDFSSYFSSFGIVNYSGFIDKSIGISAVYVVKYSKHEYAIKALKQSAGLRYMGKILIFQLREADP